MASIIIALGCVNAVSLAFRSVKRHAITLCFQRAHMKVYFNYTHKWIKMCSTYHIYQYMESIHLYTPSQEVPFSPSVYPSPQSHVNPPSVLVHTWEQLSMFNKHSLISTHVNNNYSHWYDHFILHITHQPLQPLPSSSSSNPSLQ